MTAARPARIVGVAGIVAVVAGGLWLRGIGFGPRGLDWPWYDLLHGWRPPALETLAAFLDTAGGSLWSGICTAVAVVVLLLLRRPRGAVVVWGAVVFATAFDATLKLAIARPRPPGASLTSFSYPSGHATMAAALVAALVLVIRRVWMIVIASVWTLAMMWDRTYLGVHWLSDVVAGAVLGVCTALLVDDVLHGQPGPDRRGRRPDAHPPGTRAA